MHFQNTFAVRRLLRKAKKPECDQVLKDGVLFNDLMEALEEEYHCDCANAVALSPEGKFTDFLDWLLAHSDEIIALIMKLLPLFI